MARDNTIDYLRFYGISLIILAHVNPPELLFNWRCFDVCLMLFVSGLAYSGRNPEFRLSFFIRRIKRLIIPVYLFLTCYFLLIALLKLTEIDMKITKEQVIGSYLLTGGIGFVWIIKVFLLIALITPIHLMIERHIRKTVVFFFMLILIMAILDFLIENHVGMSYFFVREFFYYAAGYSVPFLFGLRIRKAPVNTILFTAILLLSALIFYILIKLQDTNAFWLVNNYKYPPRMYYLLYGSFMSVFLFLLHKSIARWGGMPCALFVASHSMWIYLYHIPFIHLTGLFFSSWYIRFPLVYLGAAIMCYVQIKAIEHLISRYGYKPFYKYLMS